MRRALLMCLLAIVLTSVATIGLRTLPSQAEIPMSGIIIVEGADYTANETAEYSLDLINLAKEVAPRIAMEYADFNSKLNLNKSDDLNQAASIVSERIAVEYADSISTNQLQGSEALNQVAATVTPRIIVEYADYATTLALSPYLGPQQYPDDTSPPNITMTREPSGLEVNDSQDVFVSANITDLESGVRNATLQYTTDNSTDWSGASVHVVPMSLNLTLQPQNSLALSFDAAIQGQSSGTRVRFRIIAYDFAGNNATINGVTVAATYLVVPEFPSTALLSLFAMATLCATIVYRRKRAAT